MDAPPTGMAYPASNCFCSAVYSFRKQPAPGGSASKDAKPDLTRNPFLDCPPNNGSRTEFGNARILVEIGEQGVYTPRIELQGCCVAQEAVARCTVPGTRRVVKAGSLALEEDASMELPLVHETFRSWAQSLNQQGLSARFAHDLASPDEGLVLSALLLSARTDPQRRATGPARRNAYERPLARFRYLISIGTPERNARAEEALLSVMTWAEGTDGLELLTEAPLSSWWQAWGTNPRPAFLLEASVTETSRPPDTPLVENHQIDLVGREPG